MFCQKYTQCFSVQRSAGIDFHPMIDASVLFSHDILRHLQISRRLLLHVLRALRCARWYWRLKIDTALKTLFTREVSIVKLQDETKLSLHLTLNVLKICQVFGGKRSCRKM